MRRGLELVTDHTPRKWILAFLENMSLKCLARLSVRVGASISDCGAEGKELIFTRMLRPLSNSWPKIIHARKSDKETKSGKMSITSKITIGRKRPM